MKKKYDLVVYIGRFQPFHNGHLKTVQRGFELADRMLFLIGSSDSPRTPKNPWTFQERACLISEIFKDREIYIKPLEDHGSDEVWIQNVQLKVKEIQELVGAESVCLVGLDKDESTFYLRLFKQWDYENCAGGGSSDATWVRKHYFEGDFASLNRSGFLPKETSEFLRSWKKTPEYGEMELEHVHIESYKASWKYAPYPPVFVTVDALVVQSGHLLVIRRGGFPGKGLLALPGGFLNQRERIAAGALRELAEETNIKLQPEVLRKCIERVEVFDDPSRSLRGRTITHVHLIRLDDSKPLPKVRGGDDANEAFWLPFSEIGSKTAWFEDHYEIVTKMLSL